MGLQKMIEVGVKKSDTFSDANIWERFVRNCSTKPRSAHAQILGCTVDVGGSPKAVKHFIHALRFT
jgi:hypothetical protein